MISVLIDVGIKVKETFISVDKCESATYSKIANICLTENLKLVFNNEWLMSQLTYC